MKLQFIDSSETLYGAFMRLLPDTFEIDFSADGYGAASRICSFRPDILVLSAALPGNDGLRVLQTVQSAGVHPMVLLITPLVSDYVMEQAAELKIGYIMCKPCDVRAVADCILRFEEKLSGEKNPVQTCVRSYLLELNFRTNLCGYRYLMTAISFLLQNPGQSLTKELYPVVAKLHHGSWQQIERGIRLSIADAWENREGDGWALYFPHQKGKPSNSAFLARSVECLQTLQKEEAKA